jgi:hypothetical protein
LFEGSIFFPGASSARDFVETLDRQSREISRSERTPEQGFDIPQEYIDEFKAQFSELAKPLIDELSDVHSAYAFYEKRFNKEHGASLFAGHTDTRLAFKAVVGAPDYEFMRSFYLAHYQMYPSWQDDRPQDTVDNFVAACDQEYSINKGNSNILVQIQGLYELSNDEIIEGCKDDYYKKIEETKRNIARKRVIKAREGENNSGLNPRILLKKQPSEFFKEELDSIKKLDELKEEVLNKPDINLPNFDYYKYMQQYDGKKPYSGATIGMLQMSTVRKALEKVRKSSL